MIRSLSLFAALLMVLPVAYGSITGNPEVDGWTSHGNSLSNGVYVRGSANYAFDTYSTTLTVDAALAAAAGGGWSVGDTVLGVGGVFNASTIAGWSVSGTPVNSLLAATPYGPKIQVKFGTADSWTISTIAPGAGNGEGSGSVGGTNMIQVRSSGWKGLPGDPTWADDDGDLMLPEDGHVTGGTTDENMARLIWNIDGNEELYSWEILLNVTQLGALSPAPVSGGRAILTVQDRDSNYTDALIEISPASQVVPEPGTIAVWSILAMVGGVTWWKKSRG